MKKLIRSGFESRDINLNFDSIHPIILDGHFLLFDNQSCKPVKSGRNAYDIISLLKNGVEICKLKEEFSSVLVDSVINEIEYIMNKNIPNMENVILQIKERRSFLSEAMFMVTQNCNLACKYCYCGNLGQCNSKGFMSSQMAEDIFKCYLLMGGNTPRQSIIFMGGEPLLNMDVITHIIGLWEKWEHQYNGRKLVFRLATNGTLLTSEITKYLRKKKIVIKIDLDGPRNIHDTNRVFTDGQGTFDKVMDGISLLRKYNVPFSIRCKVYNCKDADQLFSFFDGCDFDNIYVEFVDYTALHKEKDQFILETFNKFERKNLQLVNIGNMEKRFNLKCAEERWTTAFNIDGNIYPWHRFVGNELYGIGNIYQGIDINKAIWLYGNYLKASRNCDSCWAVSICGCK